MFQTKEEWSQLQIRNGLEFLSGKQSKNIDDSIFGLSHLLWRGCMKIHLYPIGDNDRIRAEYIAGVVKLNGIDVDDDLLDCIVHHVLHRSHCGSFPKKVLKFRRELIQLFRNLDEPSVSKRMQKRMDEIKNWRKAASILDVAS